MTARTMLSTLAAPIFLGKMSLRIEINSCLKTRKDDCSVLIYLVSPTRYGGDYEDLVLNEIKNDPSTSVRAFQIATGVPRSNAYKILKRYESHPYHVQRIQMHKFVTTRLPRIDFCRKMLARIREDLDRRINV